MIYLDYNATTPCAPEVIAVMQHFWSDDFGNAASQHIMGKQANRAIISARKQVASAINCSPSEIAFTSGATESNNIVFLGLLLSNNIKKKRIVISSIEHKSVLEPANCLLDHGFDVVYLPVTNDGVVDLDTAKRIINEDTVLVSVQIANNEIGTIQPVVELSKIAHLNGAYFHTDAAQALGKLKIDLNDLQCDFASLSAHKVYGPKGIGALYVSGGLRNWPFAHPLLGGGQESGLRPGTSNVAAIVGFGEACRLFSENFNEEINRINKLRIKLEDGLLNTIKNCHIHAQVADRIPNTISVAFPGIPSDVLIANCNFSCFSNGSACNSGAIGNSHVLEQITTDKIFLNSTIRLSIGKYTTELDIDEFLDKLKQQIYKIKSKL